MAKNSVVAIICFITLDAFNGDSLRGKYYGRLECTYTMPNGVNPIMSKFTAVLRSHAITGSEKYYLANPAPISRSALGVILRLRF